MIDQRTKECDHCETEVEYETRIEVWGPDEKHRFCDYQCLGEWIDS